MQMEQNRKEEYQGTWVIEAFEYENARSDLVAITEKMKSNTFGYS